jgi:hypothetical protein
MNALFTLVIAACTIVAPGEKDECDYYDVPAYLQADPRLPMAAWLEAQQIAAKWAADHPYRRVVRFRLVRDKETGA